MAFDVTYWQYKLKKNFPWANASIIAICCLIYFVPVLLGGRDIVVYALNGSAPLYTSIENQLFFVPALVLHQPWRIITSAFLHANLLHITLNMWALAVIGIPLERVFGKCRFLCIYFLSSIGASLFIIIYATAFDTSGQSWMTATVGASGGIFGLLGATFFIVKKLNAPTANIMSVIFLNLIVSFSVSGISWQGHIGGLLIGGLIGWLFVELPYNKQKQFSIIYSVGIGVVLVVIIFVVIHISNFQNFYSY